jgi:hypothetical protein
MLDGLHKLLLGSIHAKFTYATLIVSVNLFMEYQILKYSIE